MRTHNHPDTRMRMRNYPDTLAKGSGLAAHLHVVAFVVIQE